MPEQNIEYQDKSTSKSIEKTLGVAIGIVISIAIIYMTVWAYGVVFIWLVDSARAETIVDGQPFWFIAIAAFFGIASITGTVSGALLTR